MKLRNRVSAAFVAVSAVAAMVAVSASAAEPTLLHQLWWYYFER